MSWAWFQPRYFDLSSRAVIKRHPLLDSARLSIFGWSYGGFAAAKATEKAPEGFFKCAISVAPVANFLYYGKRSF